MKITYKLALCLNEAFQKYLSKAFVDHESLWIEIILIVNKNRPLHHVNHAIPIREQQQIIVTKKGRVKIWQEAFFYVTEVLGRRLTLANNLKAQPTNMHALLIAYCQRAQDSRWHNSRIERGFYQQSIEDDFFKSLAINLKQQCEQLANNYSNISHRRRTEFGDYWFINEGTYLKVAEELSLFDVLKLIPQQQSTDKEPPLLLIRVIESLNKKYSLLRSCGLPPDFWLERNISITHLKELKQLCRNAKKKMTHENISKTKSYQQAFTELIINSKTWGGFKSFNDFLYSFLGQTIMGYEVEIESQDYHEESQPHEETAINNSLSSLPDKYPDDFNPVLSYVFISLIVNELRLNTSDGDGLINNPQFLKLINQHPDYAKLSKTKLIRTLQQQLHSIIKKHIGD